MKRTRPYPLSKEKILEAENLPAPELRLLVANYYQGQKMRKTMDMQLRHLGKDRIEAMPSSEIKSILMHVPDAFAGIENDLFFRPKSSMLFGDAKKVLQDLIGEVKNL